MRLFSYCIPIDDGAAPNPFWGECTLVICKPVIRRVAQVGDWVVGIGSKNVRGKNYSGKLVYAMLVTGKKSLLKYDSHCQKVLPNKIPDVSSGDYRRNVGDCIYDFSVGEYPRQREGVHDQENVSTDLAGQYALLSEHFYYFGDAAVMLPPEFKILARNIRGHRSTLNESIKKSFVEWLSSKFERNKLYGEPQVTSPIDFNKDGHSICAAARCREATLDETLAYTQDKLPLDHWGYFLALEADLVTVSRYIEMHERNYGTFSIGLTHLFLATCSEIDVVLKELSLLFTDREANNINHYQRAIMGATSSFVAQRVLVPTYGLQFAPWVAWSNSASPDWWSSYNKVKHRRDIHYELTNLGNTLNSMAALYIAIFHLMRVHIGENEGEIFQTLVYSHLRPRQVLFRMENEDVWRGWANGRLISP